MSTPLPFAPGAVRTFLLAQQPYLDLGVQLTTTRELPDPVTGPCVTIRAPGNVGVDPFLRKPLIQIDTWVPRLEILGGSTDPDEIAWRVGALCGQLVGRARDIAFTGAAWSGKWTEGPVTLIDQTRGVNNPLFRSMVRVELHMRAPRI